MVPRGEPVLGVHALGGTVELVEDREGLRGGLDRLRAPIEPAQRLGVSDQEGRALRPVRLGGQEIAVALDSADEVALRESQVGLESRPGGLRIADERRGGHAETAREVVQGRHGWFGYAGLEGADVGLGVAITGQRLLGEAGALSRDSKPGSDAQRQGSVVHHDASSLSGLYVHAGHCTRRSSRC